MIKSEKTTEKKAIKRALNLFLFFFLLFGGAIGGLVALFYQSQLNTFVNDLRSREKNTIEFYGRTIGDEFKNIVSDLIFLTGQNELLEFLKNDTDENVAKIKKEYLKFSASKKIYDQIRYLDETGMEVVRINFNRGSPVSVQKSELQDKSKRYYFSDAFRLELGEVFVSPLDLNIEGGEIEQPLKPMIRFGTPVVDLIGNKRGVVLINYLAKSFLDSIRNASGHEDSSPMLLNSDGYWLLSNIPEDEWGFMISGRAERNFAMDYPDEWARILADESGQLNTSNGLFTFSKVYPLQEGFRSSSGAVEAYTPSVTELGSSDYFWVLLSYVAPEKINKYAHQLQLRLFLLGASLFIGIALGAWFLAFSMTKRRIYQSQLINLALFDSLTGLPNRKCFYDRLGAGIEHAARHGRTLGLLFIDLDGFKGVNDSMGHEAGDQLLIKVGEVMAAVSRKSDTVARLGGDEFAILLFEVNSREDVAIVAKKVLSAINKPILIKENQVTIGASIGSAIYPHTSKDLDELVKFADLAMYKSKSKGKNTYTEATKEAVRNDNNS